MSDGVYAGSQWRHWDLHVHTPDSYEQSFEGATYEEKWEKYLAVLGELKGVSVLGITDYFTLTGYKRVAEAHAQGKLPGVDYVLPHLELRLDVTTEEGAHINIHVLASPEIVDELPSLLLSKLEFQWNGNPYTCQHEDLMRLGRAIESEHTLDDRAAFQVGARQCKVALSDLRRAFEKSDRLRHDALIAVPNRSGDGNSGLQDSGSKSLRLEVYRLVDIIISSNPSDREHFLGRGENWSRAKAESDYRCLKPCIFGSDAHDLKEIGKPPGDRYTWIKADPTFEGLKQICYEPEHRVRIGPTPPSEPIHRIEGVTLSIPEDARLRSDAEEPDEPFCFRGSRTLRFSSGLTCVIGGRGSGKSTLLNLIQESLLGGSDFFRERSIVSGSESLEISDIVDVEVSSTASGVEFVSQNQVEAFAVDHARLTDAIFSRLSKLDQDGLLRSARERLEEDIQAIENLRRLVAARHSAEGDLTEVRQEVRELQRLVASLEDEKYTEMIREANERNAAASAVRTARVRLQSFTRDLRETLDTHGPPLTEEGSDDGSSDPGELYRARTRELHEAVSAAVDAAEEGVALVTESPQELEAQEALDELNERIEDYLEERGIGQENIQDLSMASARATALQEKSTQLEDQVRDLERRISEVQRVGSARDTFEAAIHGLIEPINDGLESRSEEELARISIQYSFDTKAAIETILTEITAALTELSSDRAVRIDYVSKVLAEVTWTEFPSLDELIEQIESSGSTERATAKLVLDYVQQPGVYDDLRLMAERALTDALAYKRIEVLYAYVIHDEVGGNMSDAGRTHIAQPPESRYFEGVEDLAIPVPPGAMRCVSLKVRSFSRISTARFTSRLGGSVSAPTAGPFCSVSFCTDWGSISG